MASTWGNSWGTSWGNSWGGDGIAQPAGPVVVHGKKRKPVYLPRDYYDPDPPPRKLEFKKKIDPSELVKQKRKARRNLEAEAADLNLRLILLLT